jgi:hypothetical protein
MSIGNVIHKIFYEINSFCSNDNEFGFFDFVFNDALFESQQNEEQPEKNLSNDLIIEGNESNNLTAACTVESKLYMLLSALFPSGFYFSLIQPPD